MQPRLLQTLRCDRTIAWTALAVLVLFQFSAASHQFRHVLADSAESCGVCIQLEQSQTAVAAADSIPAPLPPLSERWLPTEPPVAAGTRLRPPPRAPPFI